MRHRGQDDVAIHLANSWDNLVLVRARVSVSLSLSPSPRLSHGYLLPDVHRRIPYARLIRARARARECMRVNIQPHVTYGRVRGVDSG